MNQGTAFLQRVEDIKKEMGTIPGILKHLRRDTGEVLEVLGPLYMDLLLLIIEAGQPLEAHGTSIEELKLLRRNCSRRIALGILEHLRFDSSEPEEMRIGWLADGASQVLEMRKHLREADFSTTDIGASEEELAAYTEGKPYHAAEAAASQ